MERNAKWAESGENALFLFIHHNPIVPRDLTRANSSEGSFFSAFPRVLKELTYKMATEIIRSDGRGSSCGYSHAHREYPTPRCMVAPSARIICLSRLGRLG